MNIISLFRKAVVSLCFTVAAWGLGVATAYAQQFVNGSFETDAWVGDVNHVTPTGWNAVQSDDSRFVQGSHNDGNLTNRNTPYGEQFIILCGEDCDPGTRGNVSQSVSGFTVGKQYTLKFAQSPEDNDYEYRLEVTIEGGGTLNEVFEANYFGSNAGYWTEWKPQSWTFTANSPTLVFTFAGLGGVNDEAYESGIDNISISAGGSTAIPTLPNLGLIMLSMLLAFGAMISLRRRRAQ